MSEDSKPTHQEWVEQLRQERSELAILCSQLDPTEWEAQSLCSEWKVRDVVAHVVGGQADILTYFTGTPARVAPKIITKYRRLNTTALTAALVAVTEPANLSRLAPSTMLHDNWVHQQDVRWVLGPQRQRNHDPRRLRILLDLLKKPTERKKRGILFKVTGSNWQAGEPNGQLITGTAEDIIMLLTRRPAALARVDGPGVAVLADRWKVKL